MNTTAGNLGNIADRGQPADHVAIIDLLTPDAPRQYTYGALAQLIDGVARFLTEKGLARGARVAILSLNRVEYVAAYLGIMKAGLVAVPVNIKLPTHTIEHIILDSDIEFAFVDAARALSDLKIPYLDFDEEGSNGFKSLIKPGTFEAAAPDAHEIAQILYTSGSTGVPKGVPLTHAGMLWALDETAKAGLEQERQIVAQPLFHMNGLMVVKSVIYNGSSIVIMPAFDTTSYGEAIAHWHVSRIFAVPTMMARVLRDLSDKNLDFSAITHVTLSSAPTTEALIRKLMQVFPTAIVDVSYGCTEAGPRIFGQHPAGKPKPILALGTVANGCEIQLIDGTTDEGVLLVRTPAVTGGYLNLRAKSGEALRDGWYYTGDVVRRDAEGFYYFVGRADDMFICSGENIYPGDVERMLEKHASVQQAAVIPLADEERGQVPTAFIVLRAGEKLETAEIKSFAIANGPAYQHPRRVAFVDELPLAGTNKIDRNALFHDAVNRERNALWNN